MELQQNRGEFQKLGLGIAAISYDSPAILHDFAERRHIEFPLLSDEHSELITQLKLLNETIPVGNAFRGVPYPGVFVLDSNGVITGKYFEDDYKQRFTSASILTQQFGIQAPASRHDVEGKQLTLTSAASNSLVRPFQRVSLVLDIHLKPGMHVYAPGVDGYIPISWTMDNSPLLTAHEIATPKPEILFLKAINEKVPVFAGEFHLSRDITLGTDDALKAALDSSGDFTIQSTFRYQACDDKVCYIPQELPLTWRFHYEAFDRERSPEPIQHKTR